MRLARRLLLYFFGAFFIAFGLTGLLDPAFLAGKLSLIPANSTGICEIRGLYGGGFAAFGLVILAGLGRATAAPALLLGIAIIFAGIACGRVLSLVLDHDAGFAVPNGAIEFVLAACCFFESRAAAHTARRPAC